MGVPTFVVICRYCGLVFQNPRLDRNSLNEFYRNYYNGLYSTIVDDDEEYLDMVKRGSLIYEFIDTKLPDYLSTPKRVLEVGCNKGGCISYFSEKGHAVQGIDLDPHSADYAKKHNLNVQSIDVLSFASKTDKKFDLIVYNHVLEHITDIIKETDVIRELLEDDGYLFAGVPSLIFGLKVNGWSIRRHVIFDHIYYFTRETLFNVMKLCGFIEVASEDSPVLKSGKGSHIYSIFSKGKEIAGNVNNMYYQNIALLEYAKKKSYRFHVKLYRYLRYDFLHMIMPNWFKKIIIKLLKI